jgi:hypothetical protein
MSGLEAMVAAMESCLGAHETNGNNTNYITKWYGLNDAWCDMTITYAAYHSGNEKAVCFNGKYAYTVAHAQAFKDRGQWTAMTNGVVNSGIRRGDIVFFDWEGGSSIGGIDHVGIVTGTDGATVYTIEGNIGNVCARKVRGVREIAGFGRPKYEGASNNAPAPSSKPIPGDNGAKYTPFPGTDWFKKAPRSPVVERMGERLVALELDVYKEGPGPQWTEADRKSYAAWQRRCGYTGADADGWPGKSSWDRLKVPR